MDRSKNLLIIKRKDENEVFPSVWLLPEGLVDYQESIESCILRQLYEKFGFTSNNTLHIYCPFKHGEELQHPI